MENKNKRNIPENEGMHESNLRQTGETQTRMDDSIPMPPPKKKKSRKALVIALIAFAVVVLAVVGYAASVFFLYEPPKDEVNNELPFVPAPNNGEEQNEQIEIEADDKQYNFLVVARDKVSGLTDVMMIINYNITEQSLSVMQIPRDTYVQIDDYYYHKINGAYSYYQSGRRGEENASLLALRDVAEYLEKNLCIKIHYTAYMNIDGFSDIVDAIGGVEMYVPQDMYYPDPEQGLSINLKEGYQTLDGEKAEQFVRFRYGYSNGDIGRGDAQKLFMTAFIKKLKSSISITDVSKLTELAGIVYDCIETDLNMNDLIYFGKNFLGLTGGESVDMENINMLTLPGGAFYYDLSYYSLNRESTIDVINKYFNIYNFDISSSFDPNKVFLNENSDKSKHMYNLPMAELETEIFNAGTSEEENS
ncbi:MAG: LCP family protein [Clostridia bacterium]|nr:LCP family protein [Clostridia bacterium]